MSEINCNGCTACCKKDTVILDESELTKYQYHIEWYSGKQLFVLDRKEDNSCIYLEETGCSIHGKAPRICQAMDCRKLYINTTPEHREIRVRQNKQMIHIYTAGAERLHTLKD